MSKNIQFVTDSEGRKTAVIVPIDDYEKLLKQRGELEARPGDLQELGLSDRTYKTLSGEGIDSIEQLSKMTVMQLLEIKYFGKKALNEVTHALSKRGITINNDLSFE
jgi:DNA-directed RNA polymerase alpha subunit